MLELYQQQLGYEANMPDKLYLSDVGATQSSENLVETGRLLFMRDREHNVTHIILQLRTEHTCNVLITENISFLLK